MQQYRVKAEILTKNVESYSMRITIPKHISLMFDLDKVDLVGFNNGPVLRISPIYNEEDTKKYMCVRKINHVDNCARVTIPKQYYDRLGLNKLNRYVNIVYHDNKLLLVKCNSVCCVCGSSATATIDFKGAKICESCIKEIKEM